MCLAYEYKLSKFLTLKKEFEQRCVMIAVVDNHSEWLDFTFE